ncbi:hypothetical protein NUACC21_19910 [Scytonema sp. NUACC21]
MSKPETSHPQKIYALLIGIDCYLENRLPDGSSYKKLTGCVRDINQVETFLKNTFNVPDAQIFKLTASQSEIPNLPKESPQELPTYENIVNKFQELTELAQPQDHIYIHYSGHGGRAVTIYPKLKGHFRFDEALVPMDIGNSQARYLRDLELAQLLQNMVDKGLLVTVVLDSCHSGGAVRGEIKDFSIRGLDRNTIDTTQRSQESLVPLSSQVMETWLQQQNTRNAIATSGWLPEPKGYVLLAACRDSEYAYEYPFEGQQNNGALTYWLLDSLQKLGNNVTYRTLHSRIQAKVNTQFPRQTPMLQGESDRTIFSDRSMLSQPAVVVKKVDLEKKRVLLQAGQAQGLRKGAEFAIYQLGTTNFTDASKRVALAKIVEVLAQESWAEITAILNQENARSPLHQKRTYVPGTPVQQQTAPTIGEGTIEDGAPAVLLSPGVKLVRKVRLLPPQENLQAFGVDTKAALEAIRTSKRIVQGNSWIELLSFDEESDEPVTYQVSVNSQREYEILDAGGETIMNLHPAIKVGGSMAGMNVVKRLVHLSKYHATLELDNNDPRSPLAGKLKVELCTVGENQELRPINAPGNLPTFSVGEEVALRIHNESSQELNITVLAIQPDWSITQHYPPKRDYEPLEPKNDISVRFRTSLRSGYTEGATVLKVFATVSATNFHCLELPVLDQPRNERRFTIGDDPLTKLLAAMASETPPTRKLNPVAYPSREWTTEQIKIVIKL